MTPTTTRTSEPFKTVLVANYSIRRELDAHIESDAHTVDEYALYFCDVKIAVLRCDYEINSFPVTKQTFSLEMLAEHYVPYITGEMHLAAAIMNTVMHHYTEDHDFLSDVLIDEEGNSIALPLMIAI